MRAAHGPHGAVANIVSKSTQRLRSRIPDAYFYGTESALSRFGREKASAMCLVRDQV